MEPFKDLYVDQRWGSINEMIMQKIKKQSDDRNAAQLPGHFGKVPCSNTMCGCQGELHADADLWLLFVFPELDAGSLMRLLCTCKALGHRFVREVQETAARIFIVQTELPLQIRVLDACSEDLEAILDFKNVAAWMTASELGLQWKEVDSGELPTGDEIESDDLSSALQGQVEFTNEELDGFEMSGLTYDSYIQVGNRYFIPVAKPYFSVIVHKAEREIQNAPGVTNSFFEYLRRRGTNPIESLAWFTRYVEYVLEDIRQHIVDSEEDFAVTVEQFHEELYKKQFSGLVYFTAGNVYSKFEQLKYEVQERREAAKSLLDRLTNFSDVLMFHSLVHRIDQGEFNALNDVIEKRIDEVLNICMHTSIHMCISI